MTKVVLRNPFPIIDRDEFLTPFDRMFDKIVESNFPDITKSVGVKPFQGTAYPKVNVYEYDDKVGVVAEIPGLDKKDLTVDVLGPVGDVVSEWNFKGAFIKDASFGDFNWDADGTAQNIDLTIEMDYFYASMGLE